MSGIDGQKAIITGKGRGRGKGEEEKVQAY